MAEALERRILRRAVRVFNEFIYAADGGCCLAPYRDSDSAFQAGRRRYMRLGLAEGKTARRRLKQDARRYCGMDSLN